MQLKISINLKTFPLIIKFYKKKSLLHFVIGKLLYIKNAKKMQFLLHCNTPAKISWRISAYVTKQQLDSIWCCLEKKIVFNGNIKNLILENLVERFGLVSLFNDLSIFMGYLIPKPSNVEEQMD